MQVIKQDNNLKDIGNRIAVESVGEGSKNYSLIAKKGRDFFSDYKTKNGFGAEIEETSGYVKFTRSIPARNENFKGSYTKWVQILNKQGNTVLIYHDTYGAGGEYLHRSIKYPRPERYIYRDARVRIDRE